MRMWIAIGVLGVIGCGSNPPGLYRCPSVLDVSADGPMDCKGLLYNERLVQTILIERGIAADLGPFVGLPIVIRTERNLDADSGDGFETQGHYDALLGVELGCGGRSLLHELMHHLDRGNLASFVHEGWYDNGFARASYDYKARARGLGACVQ